MTDRRARAEKIAHRFAWSMLTRDELISTLTDAILAFAEEEARPWKNFTEQIRLIGEFDERMAALEAERDSLRRIADRLKDERNIAYVERDRLRVALEEIRDAALIQQWPVNNVEAVLETLRLIIEDRYFALQAAALASGTATSSLCSGPPDHKPAPPAGTRLAARKEE